MVEQLKFREHLEQNIKENLTKATAGIVELNRKPRHRWHRWWNEECDKALDKRATAWKIWNSKITEDDYFLLQSVLDN